MEIAPKPVDEAERLEVLDALRILDTAPEPFFDQIAELARTLTGVQAAMVAMIDGERKWLKSCSGGALGASPRDIAFCSHTILQDEVMWIEDSRLDARFWDNPLVTGPKQLNFYAGAPIVVAGMKVGTLCLNDRTPRGYDAHVAGALKRLAEMVAAQLTARRMQLMSASVVSATNDAIVCSDSRQKIIFWNDAAERLFGRSAAEALGSELTILTESALEPSYRALWAAALEVAAAQAEKTFETTAVRRDGTGLPVEITWAAWNDGGRPGLSLIIRDCSERLHASAALRDALHHAEKANQAKTEFLAVMSHEIRTPLNGVLGMAQAMQAGELSAPQQERLRVLRRSGQVLLALLDDVLDLAKIEARKLELDCVDFDLEHLVRGAVTPFAEVAQQKGVELELRIDPSARDIFHGDAKRVRQVLHNLTSNAVKFTQVGTVSVEAAFDGDILRLRVEDTGVGIAPEKQPAIFERFVQADASTTRRFGGSGLGLSICRALVDMMQGRIEFSSEEGRGSVFTALLPLAPASRASAAIQGGRSKLESTAEPRPVRVLAAEDNKVNQLVLKALLGQTSAELVVVENGALAVDAWEKEDWDLILMDVQMPEMDGPTATRAIRSAERASGRRRTPILAVSANAMAHQEAEYRDSGMDALVTKPIDAGQLFAAIQLALIDSDERDADAAERPDPELRAGAA